MKMKMKMRCMGVGLLALSLAAPGVAVETYKFRLVVPGMTAAASQPSPVAAAVTAALAGVSLPVAWLNQSYHYDLNTLLSITGDAPVDPAAVTWAVTGGALPAGLVLGSNGVLSGTPTVRDRIGVGFEVSATYKSAVGLQTYVLVVNELEVALSAAGLPEATVGQAYSYDLKQLLRVTGEAVPDLSKSTWSVTGGALPANMTLGADGVLRGTPSAKVVAGQSFQVKAGYKGLEGQQTYTIVVNGAVLQVTQISVGRAGHACAVTTTGGAKCWGSNAYGQLGDGTTTSRSVPVSVTGLTTGVAQIAAGDGHTCAVLTSGGVMCWGNNNAYQVGDGTRLTRKVPVAVSGLSSGVVGISVGGNHSCALTAAGTPKCWGYNGYGQISNSVGPDGTGTPTAVLGVPTAKISAGWQHTCAVTATGTAMCWGYGSYGQLGQGSTSSSSTPQVVSGMASGVVDISAGLSHTCAVTSAGSAKCWGRGVEGQLGNGNSTGEPSPQAVSGLVSGVTQVTAGDDHSCAVMSNGGAKCWGNNANGQLGDGTTVRRLAPVDVSGLGGVSSISAGASNTCAIASSQATCWGFGANGTLGNGAAANRTTPVMVEP